MRGTAAHASAPEQGVNAIDQAAALIGGLAELSTRLKQQRHELLGHPTLTVCGIQGGFNDYTVPAACTLSLNRRVLPLETENDVLAQVQAVLDARARIDPTFAADVQLRAFTPAMETDARLRRRPGAALRGPARAGRRSRCRRLVGDE